MIPTLVSIELTNLCGKGNKCSAFGCYASSTPAGKTFWTQELLGGFVRDLAQNGIEAVSFGGGEPLQYPHLWGLLEDLKDAPIFKSMTSNGIYLTETVAERLAKVLDKVHISIHFPEDHKEVDRAISQVKMLETKGLRSGINFMVKGWRPEAEKEAVKRIQASGIKEDRVIFLPLRGKGPVNVDSFKDVSRTLSSHFQAPWCLLECQKSPRFISVNWEGYVGYCSYTPAKTQMRNFTHAGMLEALGEKELVFCG